MNVERIRGRLLAQVVAGRMLQHTADGISRLTNAVSNTFDDVGDTFGMVASDAAVRYRALTGIDLGRFIGQPDLFEGDEACEQVTAEDDDGEDD